MDISIRDYIKNNFKDSNDKEIKDSITSSISESVEETLPGLGVFFEMLWAKSSEEEKDNIVSKISGRIK